MVPVSGQAHAPSAWWLVWELGQSSQELSWVWACCFHGYWLLLLWHGLVQGEGVVAGDFLLSYFVLDFGTSLGVCTSERVSPLL
jgi:hypothetical protein